MNVNVTADPLRHSKHQCCASLVVPPGPIAARFLLLLPVASRRGSRRVAGRVCLGFLVFLCVSVSAAARRLFLLLMLCCSGVGLVSRPGPLSGPYPQYVLSVLFFLQ